MSDNTKGIVGMVWLTHWIGGIVAALFGNLAAAVWCLGVIALIQWDDYKCQREGGEK